MEPPVRHARSVPSRWARRVLLLCALGLGVARLAAAEPPPGAPAAETADREARPGNLNVSLAKALAALSNQRWQEAATILKQQIAADPDANQWELYQALAAAQTGLHEYPDALQSFAKGIAIIRDHPDPKVEPAKLKAGLAQMLTAEGNVYVRMGMPEEAVAVFTQAAAVSPDPARAYFNLCATLYNMGNMPAAAAAADRVIALDPKKADAYFIKASARFADGKSEGGRYVAPPDSVAALKKYLELAPTGPHADDVKAMLAATQGKSDAATE